MAAQTANVQLKTRPRGSSSYVVANATQLYAGMGVVTNAAGFLVQIADVATNKFAGVLQHDVLGNTGVTPNVEARVDDSGPVLTDVPVAGASTIGNVNDLVYSLDENLAASLTVTPATNMKAIGWIIRFKTSTSFDVQLFTPSEYLALN